MRWRERARFAAIAATAGALVVAPGGAAEADEIAVEVANASEPTLCAEHDNVTLHLRSADMRRFRIEAVHPAYIGAVIADRAPPDASHCGFAENPSAATLSQRITIYETEEWQLIGHRIENFWRPGKVPVRVGDKVAENIHLLQLWHRFEERAEEILVLYPPDGYWRARPLPPAHMAWSAYGSSFLVGPVETEKRPLVDLAAIAFDPQNLRFELSSARGGTAGVRLEKLVRERIALEVSLDPIAAKPFAALRSMFVTETNADVARIAWRERGASSFHEAPILQFERASAVELWAGRAVPSRHNLSAPDFRFSDFSATPR
jgi:hypothetical protein